MAVAALESATKKPQSDDVFDDKAMRQARDKTLGKLALGPMYNSASRLMLMIGGPLLTAGLMGFLGVGGGAIALGTTLAVAAAGAALTVTGIAVDYMGTRAMQAGGMDAAEVGAQSTARHLVQELKASNLCMTFEQNSRADGRSWVQATGRSNAELSQQV